MRITQFLGVVPKIADKYLPDGRAVIAENLDIYGNRLKPIKLPMDTQTKLMTPCGDVFTGNAVTVHSAGSFFVAWDKQVFTAVDWTRKLGETTFLFVDNGKLYRQSAERILRKECPILVGIKRPSYKGNIAIRAIPKAGCEPTKIPLLCLRDNDCDNIEHPPVPVAYLFTYVNSCGEESANSKPSEVLDMRWGDAVEVTVNDVDVPDNAVKRRWYRATTDNQEVAHWLFVGETPIGQTQFYDTNCPCDLSCELMTELHDAPPDCLEGVANLGDNLTVVWSNRHFYVSEQNFPHAYNTNVDYRLRYRILGMYEQTPTIEGQVHYTLLAITDGLHYGITGDEPTTVSIAEMQQRYKVSNPLSVTAGVSNLFYMSEQGIIAISMNGEELLTGDYITENEWRRLVSRDVRLVYYDDRIYGFDKHRGFILTFGTDKRRDASLVTHNLNIDFGYTDETSEFYGFRGDKMYEMGRGYPAQYDWKSKTYVQAGMWRPVACKVVSPDFNNITPRGYLEAKKAYERFIRGHGEQHIDTFFTNNPEYQQHRAGLTGVRPSVEVIIYADGKEYFRRCVSSNKPFLLPRKYRAIDWSIRVIGSLQIDEIHLQSSRTNLLGGD